MSCKLKENLPAGYYRSLDDIKKFKIRVRIRKVAKTCLQGKGDISLTGQSESPSTNNSKIPLFTEQIFSWQEKLLKTEEKAAPPDLEQSPDSETGVSCLKSIRLFSYVDSEIRSLGLENSVVVPNNNANEEVSRKKHLRYSHLNKTFQRSFILDEKDIIHNSNRKKVCSLPCEMMAIVADLGSEENSSENEAQLCVITWYSSGLLVIDPDFSKSPYYIQNRSLETYEFILQNASKVMKRTDKEKERKLMKQISLQHNKILNEAVGEHFEVPPSDTVLLFLNVEIASARDFDASFLFVKYSLQFSEGLAKETDEVLFGATHTSKVKTKNGVTVADIGYAFNFIVPIDYALLINEKNYMPKLSLIVEVISVDYWGIFRNEGYGFYSVALSPGSHTCSISTWKLLPRTLHEKLKHYFLGGVPCLGDTNYITVPEKLEGPCLGKWDAKTETSGSISATIHLVMQFGRESSPNDLIHK